MTSNLLWMELPAGWKSEKAKYIFRQMNREVRPEDEIVTAFRDGTVTLRTNRRTEGFTFSLKEIGYQSVRRGDLVIHAMDGFAGAIGVSDSDGKCSPVYSICQPIIPADNRYYAYLIRFLALNGFITSLARGIRERSTEFRFKEFREIELPIPPIKEQRAIADFLDRETARIDILLAKNEKLVQLLKEKIASIVSYAITQGEVRSDMKTNSVYTPWLFPLPSDWKRVSLKFVGTIKGRIGYENLRADEYTEEGPLLVSSAHFNDGFIQWEKCNHVTRERFEMSPEIILHYEDVLFMKDGALMGKLAYVDELPGEACLNSHLLLIRPRQGSFAPRFLFYVLMSSVFTAYMEQERRGTTFFGFSEQSMGNYPISLPPLDRQHEIWNYLDLKIAKHGAAIEKIKGIIVELRDYRSSLISEVVTGKRKIAEEL